MTQGCRFIGNNVVPDRTVAKIRQNLFWAFAYNVAGIPLAALAMSSVSVVSNALLLKRWQPMLRKP